MSRAEAVHRTSWQGAGHLALVGGRNGLVVIADDVMARQLQAGLGPEWCLLWQNGLRAQAGDGVCRHLPRAVLVECVAGKGRVDGKALPIPCHPDGRQKRL